MRELGLDRDLVAAGARTRVGAAGVRPGADRAEPRARGDDRADRPAHDRVDARREPSTQLAAELRSALAGADPAPGFTHAAVLASGGRLLVLPGPVGGEIAEYLRIDLALERPLDLDTATAYVLGNVAAASHGESVRGRSSATATPRPSSSVSR